MVPATLRKGQFAAALKEYKKALKINPKDARALLNVGIVYAKQAEAAPTSIRAQALRPGPRVPSTRPLSAIPVSRKLTGKGHSSSPTRGRLDEAIEDLTYAVNLDNTYTEAQEDLDNLHRRLEKGDKADADQATTRELGPGN